MQRRGPFRRAERPETARNGGQNARRRSARRGRGAAAGRITAGGTAEGQTQHDEEGPSAPVGSGPADPSADQAGCRRTAPWRHAYSHLGASGQAGRTSALTGSPNRADGRRFHGLNGPAPPRTPTRGLQSLSSSNTGGSRRPCSPPPPSPEGEMTWRPVTRVTMASWSVHPAGGGGVAPGDTYPLRCQLVGAPGADGLCSPGERAYGQSAVNQVDGLG